MAVAGQEAAAAGWPAEGHSRRQAAEAAVAPVGELADGHHSAPHQADAVDPAQVSGTTTAVAESTLP